MKINQSISKKKLFLIITVFIILLTAIRMIWLMTTVRPDQPHANNGILDLQKWKFTNNQTVQLDGEWAFYPELLKIDTIIEETDKSLISVPSNWKNSLPKSLNHSNYSSGTYHLQILLPKDNQQIYGILFQRIESASSVYINGTLAAEAGNPINFNKYSQAKLAPYTAFFSAEDNRIDLIIQAAHYNISGGITRSIKLGTEQAIHSKASFSLTMQLITFTIVLLHCLYGFSLLLFIGDKKRELFYCTMIFFSAMCTILVDDGKILLTWIPVNYEWIAKLTFLSYISLSFFILQFFRHLLIEYKQLKVFRWLFFILASLSLFILIFPLSYVDYIGMLALGLGFFSFIMIICLLVKIVRKGDIDAIYLILAMISIISSTIWGIIRNMGLIHTSYYYPYDIIITVITFSYFLFIRFYRMRIHSIEIADKLTSEMMRKDDFLANTSHELRNPLHGILNIAQTVLDDETSNLNNKNRANIELLIKVGRQMSFTLNDLLDIRRLKENDINLDLQSHRVQNVISGVIDMLRFMTEEKDIHFIQNIPETFPNVFVDINRLIQILFNLLHNAVKFTEKGTITVSATSTNHIATFYITDTGIGIDKEIQEKIFQPYEQGNSNMTFSGLGMGLGLSICQQLVKLHGGIIAVSSIPNKGSTFSFTVPLAEQRSSEQIVQIEIAATMESKPDEQLPILQTSKREGRILVVDDDPVNLKILSNILTSKYEISTATNGKEALIKLNNNEWDLVISDVMMPHMSGYELTRTIRKQFSISELPILLLTARSQPEDIYTGFAAGANDYITKPMDAVELKSRVNALAGLRRSITERLRMEAAWLQAQIQPHFLFNTLNTIASLSEIDTSKMVILLDEFGNYLRKSFDVINTEPIVPLEHELDLIRSYLFIEQTRFGERLQIHWDIDNEDGLLIPPLSIQPLVENAVRHGVLQRAAGGIICIRIKSYKTYTEIAIIDDGVGMNPKQLTDILSNNKNKGIGLANTDRRLKRLYGKGLEIQSNINEGTTIRFNIPK